MTTCRGCGDGGAAGFAAKGTGGAPFRVNRCPACGLGWTDPALPDSEIGAWYPQSYYGSGNARFHPQLERLIRAFRRRRASVIRRRAESGPVLDVGCGRGYLLKTLRELGFQPHGVELSEDSAWHAAHKLHIPVHVGPLDAAPYARGPFTAVVFWHTLEHFADPFAMLAKAHALLKPGGLLVVAVPNSESLQAALSGPDWFHLDVPRHYWHFGASSLRAAVEKSGFAVVQEDHFSFEQNPYGWLQSLLNMATPRFNYLYDWLKSKSARSAPLRKNPGQALLTLGLAVPLAPLCVLLTVLEAALRRGGSVEVYAVKR
ncbi:MAG: class I SAM-dependent methyltransferase [Elusimicrobia bacterium]|nr:class I SAM-dependent methyltransferase [Elusimicrobiota bacterium]